MDTYTQIKISSLTRRLSLGLVVLLASFVKVQAQYIGYVYPAGGQQGTTFQVTLGGQKLEGINAAFVTGAGVTARLVDYNKKMNPQEVQLLNEQAKDLKDLPAAKKDQAISNLITRIEKLVRENVGQPACASIANLAIVEVSLAPDAKPGKREIRIGTPRGLSNPLVFNVGQLPEISKPPLVTCPLVTLGKEEQSLRKKKRQDANPGNPQPMMSPGMMMGSTGVPSELDDNEIDVKIPCIVNGQIEQGAVDRYRFAARDGQRLVIEVQARELIPYIADAVPGWFQPVIVLCDSKGKELAYDDDYRFRPDPVVLYEIPADGDYHLAIYDAIYRGREDFVYRMTIGEIPFITSIFPMGANAGADPKIELKGWNLAATTLTLPAKEGAPGIYPISAQGTNGLLSNRIPFALTALPECLEKEPNSMAKTAQKVTLPVIINGHISNPGKKDVFQFDGRVGEEVVAEVTARRLDSPLDSVLKLTDSAGKILAFNDDNEDVASGLNTHNADSYIRTTLPTNGTYYIYLNDAQHAGGDEYGYRLRISAPQPDFALRAVPSSLAISSNSTAMLSIYAIRQDGFTNTIKFAVKNLTNAFSVTGSLTGTQAMTRITVKTKLGATKEPVNLIIEGTATNETGKKVHEAIPAEDRMQAFLWRHLVPAEELQVYVFNPPPSPPKSETKKDKPK